jgi:hypothetical protein
VRWCRAAEISAGVLSGLPMLPAVAIELVVAGGGWFGIRK